MKIRAWIESQEERKWLLLVTVIALVLRLGWAAAMTDRDDRPPAPF